MTKHINLKNNHLLISKVLAWQPSTKQLEQFEQLQFFLKKWNTKLNLTRLLEGNDYWIGQVIDSLWPFTNELQNSDVTKKIIDVGSGCGLPGLAIAIALPKVSLTLVDSISRKTTAIKSISEELGLNSRVSVINERVELLGQQISYRGSYDIALARAVGTAEVVAEYLVPFLDNSGEALIYKGKWNTNEQNKLNYALLKLKGNVKEIQCFDLPENRGTRHIIRVARVDQCPKKYPREVGIPKKRPLGSHALDNL